MRLRTGSLRATSSNCSHCCSLGIQRSRVSLGTRPHRWPPALVGNGLQLLRARTSRQGHDDRRTFRPLVRVHIAGNHYPGWIHIPGQPGQHQVTEMATYRQPA